MGSRKVAVVTGGSRGIGEAVARRLAAEGMVVACTATSADTAEAAASRIRGDGGVEAMGLRMQVEEPEDVERAFALVEEALGPVSVMVNNAGIASVASFLDMGVDDFSRVIDVNVKGVFNGSLTAAKRMVASGTRGSIVQIGSIAGINGFPRRVGYCSSKAAVHHMTKVMSLDLAAHGIRVNCVAPGYIRTDMVQDLVDEGKLDEAALRRRIPLGDLGEGADVAAAVAWLASDQARYVTGETLLVDGGWSAYGHI